MSLILFIWAIWFVYKAIYCDVSAIFIICVYCRLEKTALHYWSENGHVAVVEALIRGGADVNAVDNVSVNECNKFIII